MSEEAIRAGLPVRTGPASFGVSLRVGERSIRIDVPARREDHLPGLAVRIIAACRDLEFDPSLSCETTARLVAAQLRGPFGRKMAVSVAATIDATTSYGATVSTLE